MIICSDEPLAIGHCTNGLLSDINRQYQRQPFVVLAVATEAEYHAYARGYGVDSSTLTPKPFYYHVSTD